MLTATLAIAEMCVNDQVCLRYVCRFEGGRREILYHVPSLQSRNYVSMHGYFRATRAISRNAVRAECLRYKQAGQSFPHADSRETSHESEQSKIYNSTQMENSLTRTDEKYSLS